MSKLLRLEDVAGEYFGLSPAIAKRKAALCAGLKGYTCTT